MEKHVSFVLFDNETNPQYVYAANNNTDLSNLILPELYSKEDVDPHVLFQQLIAQHFTMPADIMGSALRIFRNLPYYQEVHGNFQSFTFVLVLLPKVFIKDRGVVVIDGLIWLSLPKKWRFLDPHNVRAMMPILKNRDLLMTYMAAHTLWNLNPEFPASQHIWNSWQDLDFGVSTAMVKHSNHYLMREEKNAKETIADPHDPPPCLVFHCSLTSWNAIFRTGRICARRRVFFQNNRIDCSTHSGIDLYVNTRVLKNIGVRLKLDGFGKWKAWFTSGLWLSSKDWGIPLVDPKTGESIILQRITGTL